MFENSKLIANGKPLLTNIRKLKASHVVDLCNQACEISSHENIEGHQSIFSHTASASLGGDRQPCHSVNCRLNRVYELAQFAALYSDKVYVRNFFYDHTLFFNNPNVKKSYLIESFKNDLEVYRALLPLLEAGKVEMVSFGDLCPHCLSIAALQENSKTEYEKASKELESQFYKEVIFSLHYNNEYDEFALSASGAASLLPHGTQYIVLRNPSDIIIQIPEVVKKVITFGEIRLTTIQAKKIATATKFTKEVIDSIAFELGGAHFLKTSYLSDSDLEINFIRGLSKDPVVRRRASLMGKYLTCLVPFIEYVDILSLLALREREQESFILFRSALAKAIEEYKTQGNSFTERDAQAVYSDIIQPRLAALDQKIRNAKKSFRNNGYRKLVGWAGAISAGLYTGIFMSNPIAGAAAFGATKVGAKFIGDIMSKSDVEEVIRGDDMYFLWKVKKISKA